jgi:hypothetical protein
MDKPMALQLGEPAAGVFDQVSMENISSCRGLPATGHPSWIPFGQTVHGVIGICIDHHIHIVEAMLIQDRHGPCNGGQLRSLIGLGLAVWDAGGFIQGRMVRKEDSISGFGSGTTIVCTSSISKDTHAFLFLGAL